MVFDKPLRCLTKPLEQAEILVLVRTEDFQHLDVFVIGEILDEVSHVTGNDTNITGLEVKSTCCTFGGEDSHTGAASDEERPFVCISCGNELVRRQA